MTKRLLLIVLAAVAFASYRAMRDSVRVEAKLSRSDLKTIIGGAEEWSCPKLFRQIEVKPAPDGAMSAWIREPGERWSVTVFSNSASGWKKVSWYLLGTDHSVIK
jgi:hypothetical protein